MAESPVFSPVQPRNLASTVSEQLREAITTGRLKPGEHLAEVDLSKQLGVSRAPVREALQNMRREGLVTSGANKRTLVWSPSEADVDEVLSLRVIVEVLAAEWAMPLLTDDDFAALECIVDEQQRMIESERYLELVREDKRFHEYIIHRSGHSRLLKCWNELMGQWEVMIYRRLAHDPQNVMTTVLPDHAGIMQALRASDLPGLDRIHRDINVRVAEQMKTALRCTP